MFVFFYFFMKPENFSFKKDPNKEHSKLKGYVQKLCRCEKRTNEYFLIFSDEK